MSFPGQPDYHSDVQRHAFRKQAQRNQRTRGEQWDRTTQFCNSRFCTPWAEALTEDARAFPECASKGPQRADAAGKPTPLDIRGAERIGGTVDFGLGPCPTQPRNRPVGAQRFQVAGFGSLTNTPFSSTTSRDGKSLRTTQDSRQFDLRPASASGSAAGYDGPSDYVARAPGSTPREAKLESAPCSTHGSERLRARKLRDLQSSAHSMGFSFPPFDHVGSPAQALPYSVTESTALPPMRETFTLSHDTFRAQYRDYGGPFAAEALSRDH